MASASWCCQDVPFLSMEFGTISNLRIQAISAACQ